MNEKIRELNNAAIFAVDGDCGDLVIPDEYAEKFAELIIRECARVTFKGTGPRSALNILEHFGVEE